MPPRHGAHRAWARAAVSAEDRFLYLDVQGHRTKAAKERLGFVATPHFFLLDERGTVLREWQGVIDQRVLEDGIRAAVARTP